jgi:hypothetical protein
MENLIQLNDFVFYLKYNENIEGIAVVSAASDPELIIKNNTTGCIFNANVYVYTKDMHPDVKDEEVEAAFKQMYIELAKIDGDFYTPKIEDIEYLF